jgi:hypothetical protein
MSLERKIDQLYKVIPTSTIFLWQIFNIVLVLSSSAINYEGFARNFAFRMAEPWFQPAPEIPTLKDATNIYLLTMLHCLCLKNLL